MKTGRALILPILKSTYERRDSLTSDIPDSTIFWRDHVVMWTKDIRRTLDYLSTRADMDTARFAYFGVQLGSEHGADQSSSAEPRFKAAVLYVAGLTMERSRPEVDPFNYLPRVKQPGADAEREVRLLLPARDGATAVLRPPRHTGRHERSGSCTRAATTCRARR